MNIELTESMVRVLRSLDRPARDVGEIVDSISREAERELFRCAVADMVARAFDDMSIPAHILRPDLIVKLDEERRAG